MTRPTAVPAPPFTHPIRTERLDRGAEGGEDIVLQPAAAERARIAAFLEIEAIDRMTLSGRLSPEGGRGWQFRGQLTATVVQTCVVTLEPVRAAIDTAVRRSYIPGPLPAAERDLELGEDDLDPPEPFEGTIDLGQLAVESLALALDPWPRAEGAALDAEARAQAALDDDEPLPFAGLAALKARMDRGE